MFSSSSYRKHEKITSKNAMVSILHNVIAVEDDSVQNDFAFRVSFG